MVNRLASPVYQRMEAANRNAGAGRRRGFRRAFSAPSRLLLLANIIAFAAIAGALVIQAQTDRRHVIADANSDVENLRDAMLEQTRQTLAAVDVALGSVADDIDTDALEGAATHRALATRQDTLAPTYALFILDEHGRLAATSRTRNPAPVEFSGTAAFAAHRSDEALGLFIGPPRKGKVGYARDRWIFVASRPLNHADGRFAGIVAAAVSVDYLVEFYDALRMGDDGVVGLSTDDGTVLARSPVVESYLGRTLSDTTLFRELLPRSNRGTYRAPYVTDGVDRITAYGRVPDYPLVVYVGVSATERLAGWYQRAAFSGGVGLLAIAIMAGASIALARRTRERQRQQDAHVGHLTKLTEVSTALLESPDIASALRCATDMARELVPSHQAVTSLTDDPSMAQAITTVSLSDRYAAWRGYDEKPDGAGIYREICETNRPMRLTQAELERHPAWKGFGAARDRHPPMRGWLAVPLMTETGGNLGLIQLSDRITGEFTAEDQALMTELAHVTSAALQRLRLADELREAATMANRLRAETESARAAEAKARNQVERILTSIRDAVYVLDDEWRFTYLNRHAEKILGRTADDLIGRVFWDEYPDIKETPLYERYREACDEQVDLDFQFYYPSQKRWYEVRAFPRAEGGLTVYFQDVSHWVAQEEKLRQSLKMEAVGQLTGGVAHDFNNLLTVILGNTEFLLEALNEGSEHHGYVSMIDNAAVRAADLTQRLLAFSRRQPLDPQPVDVNALIEELDPLLVRTLGEQYDIKFFGRDGIARALVDPGQLQNAIVNLAVNARDAMPDGGRVIIETSETEIDADHATSHGFAAPGRYVSIAIGDNGIGMSPEVRSRAFEPFFTTKEPGEGTGLGLSMVYGFVRQSNGHVTLYSEPGEGTEVTLYLPCIGTGIPDEDPEIPHPVQRGAERILIVEDDVHVREYTSALLRSLDYDAVAVADGASALALLERDAGFDLLLCDVILGGSMNGQQVAESARRIRPGLKVLYMSGYTQNVILHNGRLDAGARLLQKPFRRADLARKIREVLDEAD